jgi:hypothetical protein
VRRSAASAFPSRIWAATPSRFRLSKEAYPLERVQREIQLDPGFAPDEFERAFDSFVQTYNVAPHVARCSPEVLDRYCRLFERADDAARQRRICFRGIPVYAAVLPSGTIVLEGEVDEDRMGDW